MPAVFRHPLLLGRLQTRRNCWCPAGVLLSFATVTAPRGNLRKRSTCFDSGKTPHSRTQPLATETDCNMRRRCGALCAFFVAGSVRPGAFLGASVAPPFVTPSNVTDRPRNTSPRAPCASVSRARAIHRVLCVSWRLRASWSLLERHSPHCAPSFMGVHGSQYPQHYSSRPSRTLSTLRTSSACR